MNKWFVGLVVLVVGVGAGWYLLRGTKLQEEGAMKKEGVTQETPAAPKAGDDTMMGSTGEPAAMKDQVTVTYTESGFTPNAVTVKKGTNVTFMNQSSKNMWVASALHPTHQLLPGFDQLTSVTKNGTYEYTFEKVGTWKYHNHVAASDTGTVVVTQ